MSFVSRDTRNNFYALDIKLSSTVVLFLDKTGVLEWPQPPILAVPLHFRKIITQTDGSEQEI